MTKYIIITSLILALLASYFYFKPFSPQKYTGPVETIRLATSKAGVELSTLVWIADDQGYFKDQGLNAVIDPENTGVIAQEKVATGGADLAVTSDFSFVSDSFDIDNLRIIASIDHAKIMDIIARRDHTISKSADLKGKKIGVTFKTIGEYFLGQLLTFNNIAWADVQVINIPLDMMQEAIISGKVDAVVVNDPVFTNIKNFLGKNDIDWPAQGDQDVSWLVVSSEQYVKNHPETVQRFLRAILRAEELVKTNPAKSQGIIQAKFNLEQAYLDQNWLKHKFSVSLNQSLLVAMENEARWRIANKLTAKTVIPNFTDFIYTDALRKVKLEAVTLY